jgi:surface protein
VLFDNNITVVSNGFKVLDADSLFQESFFADIDLSNLDTSEVTQMKNMFSHCGAKINFGGIDTSNVTEMSCMFDMANIDKLHINNTLTSGVESMDCMFRQATIVEELDISNFDTSQVCEMMYMFSSLKVPSLKLGSFSTDGIVFSGMNEIFEGHAIDRLETSNEQLFMLWDNAKSSR